MSMDSPTVNRDAISLLPKASDNQSPREPPSVVEDRTAKKPPTDLIVPDSSSKINSVIRMDTEIPGKQSTQ